MWSFVVLLSSCVVWCCSCRVFVCVTCFSSYRYAATLVDVLDATTAVVAFDLSDTLPAAAREAAVGGTLRRRVHVDMIRPAVPGAPPDSYPQSVAVGSTLELWCGGGWWEVEVLELSGDLSGGEPARGIAVGRRVQVVTPP